MWAFNIAPRISSQRYKITGRRVSDTGFFAIKHALMPAPATPTLARITRSTSTPTLCRGFTSNRFTEAFSDHLTVLESQNLLLHRQPFCMSNTSRPGREGQIRNMQTPCPRTVNKGLTWSSIVSHQHTLVLHPHPIGNARLGYPGRDRPYSRSISSLSRSSWWVHFASPCGKNRTDNIRESWQAWRFTSRYDMAARKRSRFRTITHISLVSVLVFVVG